ncbi:MAG TPA: hypothetical protein PKA03_09380 [Tabrizicola sp.]|nr:hypothetical protein [Tabrizicola sp.]
MTEFGFVWRLIIGTFLAIGRNWSVVLRITLIPLILPLAVLAGWFYWALKSAYLSHYLPKYVGGGGEFPVFALALALIAGIGTLPVAVAWHRFELLGERPRALWPRLYPGTSFGYFGRSLLLLLIAFLIALCVILPIFPFVDKGPAGDFAFAYGSLPDPPTLQNFVLNAIFASLVTGLIARWWLILPARAIGRNMTLKESRLAATARLSLKGYVLMALTLHLLSIGVDLLLGEVGTTTFGLLLVLPCGLLFWFMFTIALVTRLYGHCVEGRSLR